MTASRTTKHFGLPVPNFGGRDWGQKLLDWFDGAETTLGCNTNLVRAADVDHGIGERYTLAALDGAGNFVKADPSAGRWGRLLLQAPMVAGDEVLARLLGVSLALGLPVAVEAKGTVYHSASGNRLTDDPDHAVFLSGGRLQFLPLGFAFSGGGSVFFNGLLPVQACPTIMSGRCDEHRDGSGNPADSFALLYDSGPAYHLQFDAAATVKHLDLLFPFVVGGDFDRWLATDSETVWGARATFKTQGSASLVARSVIDAAGVETMLSADPGASDSAYGTLTVKQKTIADADGDFTPGRTAYLRLRASGGSSAQIWVRPNLLLQYFPWYRWEG